MEEIRFPNSRLWRMAFNTIRAISRLNVIGIFSVLIVCGMTTNTLTSHSTPNLRIVVFMAINTRNRDMRAFQKKAVFGMNICYILYKPVL
jgi:hypothetical protein